VAETEIREEATPGGDRFIVEGAGAARTAAPSKPAATTKATASKPAPEKNAPALGSGYIVQVSAFSSEARANAVAKATGGKVVKSGSVWRVRMGPYKDEAAAQKALNDARAKGYRDARIMRDK
jgi:rare lipoprotein A